MKYAYRLVVAYPEGVDSSNPPPGWEPRWEPGMDPEAGPDHFSWPPERLFLSRSGAGHRADLLRGWGCTVTVERSNPVTWPEEAP